MPRPLLLILPLLACKGADAPDEETAAPTTDTDTAPPEPTWCEALGYSERPFSEGPYGATNGAIAEDFTLETLRGPWTLSEHWTGCDVYVFFNFAAGYATPEEVLASAPWEFFEDTPRNVHYFFTSYDQGQEEAQAEIWRETLEYEYDFLDEEEQAFWDERLHYVTESPWTAGWIGEMLQESPLWGFGVDQHQRIWDFPTLSNQNAGWTAELRSLTFEAQHYNYLATLEDRLAAQDDVTVVTAFDGSVTSSADVTFTLPDAETMAGFDTLELDQTYGCGFIDEVECGEWDYLAYAYLCDQPPDDNPYADTPCQPAVAEVPGTCVVNGEPTETPCTSAEACDDGGDAEVSCEGYAPAIPADTQPATCEGPDGEPGEASYVCEADGSGYGEPACPCDTELGRSITGYYRGGRWVHDASPLLAMLQDGGPRTLRYRNSYAYRNRLDLRLSNTGKGDRPQQIHWLQGGGGFNEGYNSGREPVEVDIPAEATRVQLYAVISGHGWGADKENCAEFCDHEHHFTINGQTWVKDHPEAGTAEGCLEQIPDGTSPNQGGTWRTGRGGWCPGKEVTPWIVDVTEAVTPGETATITYQGLFEGEDYSPEPSGSGQGFGARIDMVSYLVVSW